MPPARQALCSQCSRSAAFRLRCSSPCSRSGCDDQRTLAVAVTALEALALLGLLVAPDVALVWVALFALGQGGAIGLALTLMVLRAPDAKVAAELSGMAQGFGYALAAFGPFAIGALNDWSGSWNVALTALIVVTVPLIVVGVEAGRARTVGAEPARSG